MAGAYPSQCSVCSAERAQLAADELAGSVGSLCCSSSSFNLCTQNEACRILRKVTHRCSCEPWRPSCVATWLRPAAFSRALDGDGKVGRGARSERSSGTQDRSIASHITCTPRNRGLHDAVQWGGQFGLGDARKGEHKCQRAAKGESGMWGKGWIVAMRLAYRVGCLAGPASVQSGERAQTPVTNRGPSD